MHFEGDTKIKAPRQKVWDFVTDPEAVSPCFPGVQSLETVTPDKEFRLVVKMKFGAIETTFDLNVSFVLAQPPGRARLGVRGHGPNTHIGASSVLALNDSGDGSTEMNWSFDVAASGLVATYGARMIEQMAHRLTTQFVDALKQKLETP